MVKICGLTREQDIALVDAERCDLAGFIFHPGSKRVVTPDIAVPLMRSLQHSRPVAVFGFDEAVFIMKVWNQVSRIPGSMLQLPATHPVVRDGRALPEPERARIIPVLYANEEGVQLVPEAEAYPLWLIDTAATQNGQQLAGGSGISFPWKVASSVKHTFLIAGGLTPENVSEAIRKSGAAGADSAGGTEASTGIKDPDKVKAFIRNARSGNPGHD